MKISKLLFLAVAVFFLSCGDDDEDPKPTSDGFAGTWAVTGIDYTGTSTNKTQGMELTMDFTGKGKNMNMSATFSENPNKVATKGDYTIAMTMSYMGMEMPAQDFKFEGFMGDGTWELDGKKLTVTSNGQTQEGTIIEQTTTTLKVGYDFVKTMTATNGGMTGDVTMNVKGTYTFTRK
jgi:hypothetical protein